MERRVCGVIVAAALCAGVSCGLCGCGDESSGGASAEKPQRVTVVSLVKPQTRPLSQTTTQPATVHAYQQAEVFAKVSGYVEALKTDIGRTVKENDVLAVLSVPEMVKAKESQLAEVKRLEAMEARREAEKELAVAQEKAARAQQARAQSQVEQALAQLKADKAERDRVQGLVADMSLERRLLDEAVKRYESSLAGKSAADAALTSAAAEAEVAAKQITVAQKLWEAAKQDTEVARRKRDELTEMLKYAELTARFDGVVTERNVDVGDLVRNVQTAGDAPRKPLFVVADLRRVRVHAVVPENDAPLVKDGAKAVLAVRSLPGRTFEGYVTRSSQRLDERTRTMLVEVVLDNPDRELLPGMYGEVTIGLQRKPKTLVLPAEAVRYDSAGKATLYVLDSGDTVRIVAVQTGIDFGDEIEITEGLQPDDRVVGPIIGRLKSGQKVRVQ